MPKNLGTFQAAYAGTTFFDAIPASPAARAESARWMRVRDYGGPVNVGAFISSRLGSGSVKFIFAEGEVPVLSARGRILADALPYLVELLSGDEIRLLQTFGINVAKLVRK